MQHYADDLPPEDPEEFDANRAALGLRTRIRKVTSAAGCLLSFALSVAHAHGPKRTVESLEAHVVPKTTAAWQHRDRHKLSNGKLLAFLKPELEDWSVCTRIRLSSPQSMAAHCQSVPRTPVLRDASSSNLQRALPQPRLVYTASVAWCCRLLRSTLQLKCPTGGHPIRPAITPQGQGTSPPHP